MAKVLLIKTYVDRLRGNLYPSSDTPIDELLLPAEIRNDPNYVRSLDEEKPTSIPATDTEILETKLDTGLDKDDVKIEIDEKIVYEEVSEELKTIDINKADFEELLKLPHIGKAIANKIIQERNKRPFTSVEDLNARVPLKFGASWTDISSVTVTNE
ncbi:MAG: ComEA family DNA-binding protein [Candidatus Gracilibacteria bacterium]